MNFDIPTMTEDEKNEYFRNKILEWRRQNRGESSELAEEIPQVDELELRKAALQKMASPDYSNLPIGEQESPDLSMTPEENNQVISEDNLKNIEAIRKILELQKK